MERKDFTTKTFVDERMSDEWKDEKSEVHFLY